MVLKLIGIDLGTTNTVACYEDGGRQYYLDFETDGVGAVHEMLPSVFYLEYERDEVPEKTPFYQIGRTALERGAFNPERMIRSSKTNMSRQKFSYPNPKEGHRFRTNLVPEDIAYYILLKVKETMIKQCRIPKDEEINAVITVPAYFSPMAVARTKTAGKRAGFHEIKILWEPVAAAYAYIKKEIPKDTQILVVDFGGGTLDLTFMKYHEGYSHENGATYEIIASGGNSRLGGDDFDNRLVEYFKTAIKDDFSVNLESPETCGLSEKDYYSVIFKLRDAAVKAKHQLSQFKDDDDENQPYAVANISVPNLISIDGVPRGLEKILTLRQFNQICRPIYEKFAASINNLCVESTRVKPEETKQILLVGGTCNIPEISRILRKLFHGATIRTGDLAHMVANGAAIEAETTIFNEETDIVPEQIPRPEKIKEDEKVSAPVSVEPQTHRDGHVVTGIAVHDLGVAIEENGKRVFDVLIPRGTHTPCTVERIYTTNKDYAQNIPIVLYSCPNSIPVAERTLDKCERWGTLLLDKFMSGKRGEPRVSVTISQDTNGWVEFSARDCRTPGAVPAVKQVNSYEQENCTEGMDSASPPAVPVDMYLLLDNSKSMNIRVNGHRRIEETKKAVNKIVSDMIDFNYHRVGIYTFGSETKPVLPLSNDKEELIARTNQIIADGVRTHVNTAMQQAGADLEQSVINKRKAAIVLLTDGDFHDSDETLIRNAEKLKGEGIIMIMIGAERDGQIDYQLLRRLASDRADGTKEVYAAEDPARLQEIFGDIVVSLMRVKDE